MYITVTDYSNKKIDVFLRQVQFIQPASRGQKGSDIFFGENENILVKENRLEIQELIAAKQHLVL